MQSKSVVVTSQIGLQARHATAFTQKANEYNSNIWLEYANQRTNAKSLLAVGALAIACGAKIEIIADGPDEAQAVEGLAELVDSAFKA
ncbi:MAG: HPr family phosphocarrier protein [Pseudomonas sp.]